MPPALLADIHRHLLRNETYFFDRKGKRYYSMNKFAVVIPYFGKLRSDFGMWYESARRNCDVDFFVFADDNEPKDPAPNVKWHSTTLAEVNALAVQKIGVEFKLSKAYKLCDLKPMYGVIFEDYLQGYEYWAYGDIDIIYGHISEYMERIDYRKYEKINHAGHFCFIKNDSKMNCLFKAEVPGTRSYQDVLQSANVAFDEVDMNKKARALQIAFYDGIFAADIMNEAGMQCVDAKMIKEAFQRYNSMPMPKNYHYQLFVCENGGIFRYYRHFCRIKKEEFCYIHYRLRLASRPALIACDTFIISLQQNGFYEINLAQLHRLRSFMKCVKTYNNRKPILVEKLNAVVAIIKKLFKHKGEI